MLDRIKQGAKERMKNIDFKKIFLFTMFWFWNAIFFKLAGSVRPFTDVTHLDLIIIGVPAIIFNLVFILNERWIKSEKAQQQEVKDEH